MKTRITIVGLAAAALFCSTGCDSRKQTTAQPTPAKAASDNAVGNVGKQAAETMKEVAAAGSAKAQELIASAQGLVAQGKLQDALAKLKEIGGEKLSPAQQSAVDSLKAQIEKALASSSKAAADAVSGAGGLLKK